MGEPGRQRVTEVATLVSGVLIEHAAGRALSVVVDGDPEHARQFAGLLAETVDAAGQPAGAIVIGAGPGRRASPPAGGWDAVIYLRTRKRTDDDRDAAIVIDYHDPSWPVIRHLDPALADLERWYLSENRAFFGVRAATWDAKFGDDLLAYAAAVSDAGLRPGETVLDVGCGTGRALPGLRAAVGPTGVVVGLDITAAMLGVARGRAAQAGLVFADARRLPIRDARADAVFAAGLVQHLPDPRAGLAEFARVTRAGGLLIVFHPTGRAALAARHGRTLRPDEPLGPASIGPLLSSAGWAMTFYDDADDRFFATARRC